MEGNTFPASGHRNAHGRPQHFQGPPQRRGNHGNHLAKSYNQHDGEEASSNSAYYGNGNNCNEGYQSYQQGFQTRVQSQWYQYANSQHAQNRKPLVCGPCNRSFYSKQRMDEHLKDHVECPFPECKLSAHIKIIDQHINNQHMLVNFSAIQIDDETWIAERKKRFPTAQRAELRRTEQMEKIKRGEKLGVSKKPFDKKKGDRNPKRGRNSFLQNDKEEKDKTAAGEAVAPYTKKGTLEEKSSSHSRFKKRPRRERPPAPSRPTVEVDLYESDEEVLGIPRFKGTKQYYESTGEMNYFSQRRSKEKSPEKDIAISDDEEWEAEAEKKEGTTAAANLVLGGALGSLMGAYSDSEEETEGSPSVSASAQVNAVTAAQTELLHKRPTNRSTEQVKVEDQHNNDEASKARMKRRPRAHKRGKGPSTARRVPKRRKTLLERLLQSDIIHERNVILQCVRYVVENDFFDNVKGETDKGQSASQENETESEVSSEKERCNVAQESATDNSTDLEASSDNSNVSCSGGLSEEQGIQEQKLDRMEKEVENTKEKFVVKDCDSEEKADVENGNADDVCKPDVTARSECDESSDDDSTKNIESDVSAKAEESNESEDDDSTKNIESDVNAKAEESNESEVNNVKLCDR